MATDVHEWVGVEELVAEGQVRLSFIDEKDFICRKPALTPVERVRIIVFPMPRGEMYSSTEDGLRRFHFDAKYRTV